MSFRPCRNYAQGVIIPESFDSVLQINGHCDPYYRQSLRVDIGTSLTSDETCGVLFNNLLEIIKEETNREHKLTQNLCQQFSFSCDSSWNPEVKVEFFSGSNDPLLQNCVDQFRKCSMGQDYNFGPACLDHESDLHTDFITKQLPEFTLGLSNESQCLNKFNELISSPSQPLANGYTEECQYTEFYDTEVPIGCKDAIQNCNELASCENFADC